MSHRAGRPGWPLSPTHTTPCVPSRRELFSQASETSLCQHKQVVPGFPTGYCKYFRSHYVCLINLV